MKMGNDSERVAPEGEAFRARTAESARRRVNYFYRCRQCGAWVDKRNLCDVFAHEMTRHEPPETKPH
jgi:hypothetical protein